MGIKQQLTFLPCLLLLTIFAVSACSPLEQGPSWTRQQQTTGQHPLPTIEKTSVYQGDYNSLPTVKVAVLLPLSGKHGALGQSMLQAAQMAVFEMGYNNFTLISRDTKGSANDAAIAAQDAINDGAQLILGPLFAHSVNAVKPVARRANINIISFSTDQSLADRHTFLMGFIPEAQVTHVTNYALSQGYKTFGLIAPSDRYGDIVSNAFQKTLYQGQGKGKGKEQGQITRSIRYIQGDPDIVNKVAALKEQQPQAVFMPVGGTMVDAISNALSYHYMLPSQVRRIGTGLWDDVRFANQPNMEGAWFAAPSPNARAGFERRYQETFGQAPMRLATLAYDATALAAVLAKTGFTTKGSADFSALAISNPKGFSGMDGAFRFKPDGMIERNLAILEMQNGQIIERQAAAPAFYGP